MNGPKRLLAVLTSVALIATGLSGAAHAEMSAEELAKISQNPVGNLVSVPFQNNTNFNTGPRDGCLLYTSRCV